MIIHLTIPCAMNSFKLHPGQVVWAHFLSAIPKPKGFLSAEQKEASPE